MKFDILWPAILLLLAPSQGLAEKPVDIGSQLELFVDDELIHDISGDARLRQHRPRPREVVLVTDDPWEGNTSAYYTIFRDGDLFRMYYRGSHWDEKKNEEGHRELTCYAESQDGIRWTKPRLGLVEFNGSKENNIVWDGLGTHCFAPFKDGNANCSPDARYKAISRGWRQGRMSLYAFKSPDGIQWSFLRDEPIITKGAFDSQNLAFWDPHAGIYREYHRAYSEGVRDIMTSTSHDFVNWTEPVLLDYGDAPRQHLYTNAVQTYPRAPHMLLGFPTRFLPDEGERVEPTLMTSRDGRHFKRWLDALIPEEAPRDRDGNRSNYLAWGVVTLPHNDQELSVYATEAYYTGPDSRLRRFTFRQDGFVSLTGGVAGGSLVTKPLLFDGKQLTINFVAAKGGRVRVEIQTVAGKPVEGFTLQDCQPLVGDQLEKTVVWTGGNLGQLCGKSVRIRVDVTNSDVYAFRFR